jgi:hypothetical protein
MGEESAALPQQVYLRCSGAVTAGCDTRVWVSSVKYGGAHRCSHHWLTSRTPSWYRSKRTMHSLVEAFWSTRWVVSWNDPPKEPCCKVVPDSKRSHERRSPANTIDYPGMGMRRA